MLLKSIRGPIIKAKLSDALWLSAFPEQGNMGERGDYDADSYAIVWSGSSGKAQSTNSALADDEIPF